MRFEALQAEHGDCLFLVFDGPERSHRIIIDGGPNSRTAKTLSERLHLEREKAELPDNETLGVDAVMISHIDDDHIVGVLRLFDELNELQGNAPLPWRPRWLLHNSFDDLVGESVGGAARVVGGETVLAGLGSNLLAVLGGDGPSEDVLKILQSYPNGRDLSSAAAALKITRNPPEQAALQFAPDNPRVLVFGDLRMTIVGPLGPQIDRLREEWGDWKAGKKPDKTFKGFAKSLDASITNLSSIVVLVEHGEHSLLLTGDAQGPLVLKGLDDAGLLTKGKLNVDVLKLPHHGSIRNLDEPLLKAVRAKHYVASGNGKYGNPDRATLELLEQAVSGKFTLHLTYSAADCDAKHREEKENKGEAFKPSLDGIAPVVKRWRKDVKRITVKEGPVAIDLG
jgi:hypothetical protein